MAKKSSDPSPCTGAASDRRLLRNEEIEQPTSPSGGVEVAILCDNTKEPQV